MHSKAASPVIHLELHTGDLRGAVDFYARLFGWRPEPSTPAPAPTSRSRWATGWVVASSSVNPNSLSGSPTWMSPTSADDGAGPRARRRDPPRPARGAGGLAQRGGRTGRRRGRLLAVEERPALARSVDRGGGFANPGGSKIQKSLPISGRETLLTGRVPIEPSSVPDARARGGPGRARARESAQPSGPCRETPRSPRVRRRASPLWARSAGGRRGRRRSRSPGGRAIPLISAVVSA